MSRFLPTCVPKFGMEVAMGKHVSNLDPPIFPPTGTSPAQQVSKEVQRRYDAITLYLAEKAAAEAEVEEVVGDRKVPLKLKQRPRTTPAPEGGVRVTAAGDNSAHGLVTPERFRGGEHGLVLRSSEAMRWLSSIFACSSAKTYSTQQSTFQCADFHQTHCDCFPYHDCGV